MNRSTFEKLAKLLGVKLPLKMIQLSYQQEERDK